MCVYERARINTPRTQRHKRVRPDHTERRTHTPSQTRGKAREATMQDPPIATVGRTVSVVRIGVTNGQGSSALRSHHGHALCVPIGGSGAREAVGHARRRRATRTKGRVGHEVLGAGVAVSRQEHYEANCQRGGNITS